MENTRVVDNKGHSMSMGVADAFAHFMKASEAWGCRAVALAHPAESFETFDGRAPALWLSARQRFPGFAARLIAELGPDQREAALSQCARLLAAKALSKIHVCMEFQFRAPERSASRRLSKEARLSKELSKLIGAACADGFASMAARRGALEGVKLGVGDFKRLNPASVHWVAQLGWDALADKALARAEAKALGRHAISPLAEGQHTGSGACRL